MSNGRFCGFPGGSRADEGKRKGSLSTELYDRCKELQRTGQLHTENVVQKVYKSFTTQEISDKIAQLITPSEITTPVQVIYQTIENLHKACSTNTGGLVLHRKLPNPRRKPGREQGIYELYGREKCTGILNYLLGLSGKNTNII